MISGQFFSELGEINHATQFDNFEFLYRKVDFTLIFFYKMRFFFSDFWPLWKHSNWSGQFYSEIKGN